MNNPIVSIITPCYNQEEYLAETLECILAQTFQFWECIIVNDGSTDNTEGVAMAFVNRDNRFKYYFKNNSGVCETRNFAVTKSKGTYLLPLDSDDIIGDGYLQDAVDLFKTNEQIDLIHADGVFFGGYSGQILLKPFEYKILLLENTFFCPVFFKKKDFERVGGYNVNMKKGWEDWELMISLLDEKSIVVKIPKVYYHYRILQNSRERMITLDQKYELFMQIYNNHKDTYDRFFPEGMFYAFLYNQQKNENKRLENVIQSILNSKKYKIAQKIGKLNIVRRK